MAIPATIGRQDILKAIEYMRKNKWPLEHESREYDLIFDEGRFPPKYTISLAYRFATGQELSTYSFYGGDQSNNFLVSRGFVISSKNDSRQQDEHRATRDWSRQEVWMTVENYMSMLKLELQNLGYNKTANRNELLKRLGERTSGSVERKHQNISAVLAEIGLPYINGYKPLGNYQGILRQAVLRYLSTDPALPSIFQQAADQVPENDPEVSDLSQVLVPPPNLGLEDTNNRISKKQVVNIDYSSREAANKQLGRRGERFVVQFEKRRLTEIGRQDLAEGIEWVSETKGDGFGYDIHSYEADGNPRIIEVKTTNRGIYFPFIISARELELSHFQADYYQLYRLFDFSSLPRMFILRPPIKMMCKLRPLSYEARF